MSVPGQRQWRVTSTQSSVQNKTSLDNRFVLHDRRCFLHLSEVGEFGSLELIENFQNEEQRKQMSPTGIYKGTHKGQLVEKAILHQIKMREAKRRRILPTCWQAGQSARTQIIIQWKGELMRDIVFRMFCCFV